MNATEPSPVNPAPEPEPIPSPDKLMVRMFLAGLSLFGLIVLWDLLVALFRY